MHPYRSRITRQLVSALLAALVVLTASPRRSCSGSAGAEPGAGPPGTGTIRGQVRGPEGPASDASIAVVGTGLGTMADENGNFVIRGVPAGTNTLRVFHMGTEPSTQQVEVRAGEGVSIVLRLGPEKVRAVPEVVVLGRRRIDVRASDTRHTMTGEQLRDAPVDGYKEVLATQAGVVATSDGMHVRGGRVGEVKTRIEGVEVTDPAFGGSGSVAMLAVDGADLVSGGFDAEYGNALSGVVSITTREGTPTFGGQLRWDTDRYGDPTKTFNDFDRIQLGFGGPTPIRKLTYFATYEGSFLDGYLKSDLTRPRRTLLDFVQVGNRRNNQVNTNVKLAYRLRDGEKLTLEAIHNRSVSTPYVHMWSRKGYVQVQYDTTRVPGQPVQLSPRYGRWSDQRVDSSYLPMNLADHVPTTDDRFQQWTGVWTHAAGEKTAWITRASALRFHTVTGVGLRQPWEYDTQAPFYWSGNSGPGTENDPYFATHGDFPAWSRRSTNVYFLKSDVATGHWRHHSAKTGVEARYNEIRNLSLLNPNAESGGLPGGTRSDYENHNPEGSAYVQDRWEFEGLVLNVGLRYDLFTPGEQVANSELRSGRRYKQQLSPRLGIAYPVSDRDALSFHYGWTYQTPDRQYLFENRGLQSTVAVRGNPDLEPETDVSYQAGLQHLFSKDVSGQLAVFLKDTFGQITVRQEKDVNGNLVNVYFNGDYASARGFEATVSKSFSHKFSGEANYTYQIATGVASDPNQALQFYNGGRLYLPIAEQALKWDQRHTVSVLATVRDPGKWGMRMLWSYGSGLPYTPAFRNDRRPDPVLTYSRRRPSISRLTIDGDKYYRVWGQNLTLFVDARNVLDSRNIRELSPNEGINPLLNTAGDDYGIYYTETGRAGGAYLKDTNGDLVPDWVPVSDPRVFEEGRNVRMGVSVAF